uniref:Uncharacterized protein n=1 Tax=Arundo donax TaxID=35708 RepID=A0A0A9B4X3_ARUDO
MEHTALHSAIPICRFFVWHCTGAGKAYCFTCCYEKCNTSPYSQCHGDVLDETDK